MTEMKHYALRSKTQVTLACILPKPHSLHEHRAETDLMTSPWLPPGRLGDECPRTCLAVLCPAEIIRHVIIVIGGEGRLLWFERTAATRNHLNHFYRRRPVDNVTQTWSLVRYRTLAARKLMAFKRTNIPSRDKLNIFQTFSHMFKHGLTHGFTMLIIDQLLNATIFRISKHNIIQPTTDYWSLKMG